MESNLAANIGRMNCPRRAGLKGLLSRHATKDRPQCCLSGRCFAHAYERAAGGSSGSRRTGMQGARDALFECGGIGQRESSRRAAELVDRIRRIEPLFPLPAPAVAASGSASSVWFGPLGSLAAQTPNGFRKLIPTDAPRLI